MSKIQFIFIVYYINLIKKNYFRVAFILACAELGEVFDVGVGVGVEIWWGKHQPRPQLENSHPITPKDFVPEKKNILKLNYLK